jgi:hypothetical protein
MIPAVISPSRLPARADHSNKPGTDGDRLTRTDGPGDPQPTPARGTTITTEAHDIVLYSTGLGKIICT